MTAESRDLLSLHETVAQFSGRQERPCFHKTSLCPDRCSHGGSIAIFTILKYLKYEKPGKYGDAKSDKFMVKIRDIGIEFRAIFDGLKEGDHVLLSWNHDYVHRDGSSFPKRPITKLMPITKDDADKM